MPVTTPTRKPGESPDDFYKRRAWETGQFWNPDLPQLHGIKQIDLPKLTVKSAELKDAFRSLSQMMPGDYATAVIKHHKRVPDFDGELGPAMKELLEAERCAVPDYAPPPGTDFAFSDPAIQEVAKQMQLDYYTLPALGNGNWRGCHNIGSFHCAVMKIDESKRPSFLTDAALLQVLKNTQDAYAETGLWIIFVNSQMKDYLTGKDMTGEKVDINSSWVSSSDGWIGLAIVGQNVQCSSGAIWQRYLNTYRGGSTVEAIIRQWTSLWKHETGHNVGMGHSNGGVMNPSIVNNLPTSWKTDVNWGILAGKHGGEAYIPPNSPPNPPPNNPNPGSIEDRLKAMEAWRKEKNIQDAVQNALIADLQNSLRNKP